MTKKTSQRRTEAFFKALSETGNQTISAERACVSRSWVSQHRATDLAFKARMEVAIAQARARLSGAGSTKPDTKWGNIHGEELVVRGSNGRRAQVSRARLRQITPRVEARFLATLRATCNVKLACQSVGLSAAAAYKHCDRWPAFAKDWEEAVKDGQVALECALLENGIRTLQPDNVLLADEPALPMQPMSTDDVLRILGQRRGRLSPDARPAASEAEACAAIRRELRRLAILRGDPVPPVEREWNGRGLGRVKGRSG